MDPINPIVSQPPTPLPVSAPPRVQPAGRDPGQRNDDGRQRRDEPEREPADDPNRDEGRPHIDVTA
jgi:hypothetical protein